MSELNRQLIELDIELSWCFFYTCKHFVTLIRAIMKLTYENGMESGISPLKNLTNTHFGQNVNLTDVDGDWCVQAEQQGATHAGPGPFESRSKVFSLSGLTETF